MSTALGSNLPRHAPSPANAVTAIAVHPADVADWLAHPYNSGANTGAPGITLDTCPAGVTQPDYGGVSAPDAPLIHLALGTGGTITSFARISADGKLVLKKGAITIQLDLADIPSGFGTNSSGNYVIKLREVQDCLIIGGTPTVVYRQALVSPAYRTPLGNV